MQRKYRTSTLDTRWFKLSSVSPANRGFWINVALLVKQRRVPHKNLTRVKALVQEVEKHHMAKPRQDADGLKENKVDGYGWGVGAGNVRGEGRGED